MTQPTICNSCHRLATYKGQCDECRRIPTFRTRKPRKPSTGRRRKMAYALDGDMRMIQLRKKYMSQHIFCAACALSGDDKPAQELDHIIPVRVAPDLKYTESNWQPLCKSCHSWKTQQETNNGVAYDFIRVKIHDLIGR